MLVLNQILLQKEMIVDRHQQLQQQEWRANIDIQLMIDHYAFFKYLFKYVSKTGTRSAVVREAFVHLMNNVSEATASESSMG